MYSKLIVGTAAAGVLMIGGLGGGLAVAMTQRVPATVVHVAPQVQKPLALKPAALAKTSTPTPKATTPAPAAPASAAPAPAPALPQFSYANAEAVVTQYYQDLTDQNYQAAWALGGDNLNGGTGYATWVQGYDTTASISLGTFSQWGSDQVQVSIYALQTDGSVNTYEGTYTVQGGVITSASIMQTS
jgi:hypothetical protein